MGINKVLTGFGDMKLEFVSYLENGIITGVVLNIHYPDESKAYTLLDVTKKCDVNTTKDFENKHDENIENGKLSVTQNKRKIILEGNYTEGLKEKGKHFWLEIEPIYTEQIDVITYKEGFEKHLIDDIIVNCKYPASIGNVNIDIKPVQSEITTENEANKTADSKINYIFKLSKYVNNEFINTNTQSENVCFSSILCKNNKINGIDTMKKYGVSYGINYDFAGDVGYINTYIFVNGTILINGEDLCTLYLEIDVL